MKISKTFRQMWALVSTDHIVPGAVFYYKRDCIDHAVRSHGDKSWEQLRRMGYRVIRFDAQAALTSLKETEK